MRLLLLAALIGCAPLREPCEFDVHVRVLNHVQADAECHTRSRWLDSGKSVKDVTWLRGCSGDHRIITNGTESNMGHEMKHQLEANCK